MVYETNKWVSVAPMNVARMKHSLCVADGLLYAIGGVGKGNRYVQLYLHNFEMLFTPYVLFLQIYSNMVSVKKIWQETHN